MTDGAHSQSETAARPVGQGRLAAQTPAPDLELPDQHGVPTRLSSYHGRSQLLLVFYPFAFTSVCTQELAALDAELSRLSKAGGGTTVLACSCDSMFTLRVFAERERLSFPLLSDFWPHGAAARSYGVFDAERGCALRGTFVIDRAGLIRWSVVNALPDARAVDTYLEVLQGS